jgi:hypothetical protein
LIGGTVVAGAHGDVWSTTNNIGFPFFIGIPLLTPSRRKSINDKKAAIMPRVGVFIAVITDAKDHKHGRATSAGW